MKGDRQLQNRRQFVQMGAAYLLVGMPIQAPQQKRMKSSAAARFSSLLGQLHSEPDLAVSSRGMDEVEMALRSGLERAPIRAAKSATPISSRASDLIVYCEVTNKEQYDLRYNKPVWPRGASGVTIGIGYDLGYTTPQALVQDWDGYISTDTINSLSEACGITGTAAGDFVSQLPTITIDWDAALKQFSQESQPRYVGATVNALPNTNLLSQDSLGALVSLVYNRGASFSAAGSRFLQMRNIESHMEQKSFDKIPAEIRGMKDLWASDPNRKGLLIRREAEATLFELGMSQ